MLNLLLKKAGSDVHKAGLNPGENPGNPGNPETPERAEIGPRLPETDEWVDDYVTGTAAKAAKWKRRTMRPSKDPIKEGQSEKAESKFADKMKKVIDNKSRAKGLGAWTFDEWGDQVAATKPGDYADACKRKSVKLSKKIAATRDFRIYILGKLDTMPVGTVSERDAKLLANKHCMEILGDVQKGIITVAEGQRKVDAECGGRSSPRRR